jgi:hypothetical protein
MRVNFIPRPNAKFNDWQGNLTTKVAPRAPALNISLEAVADLQKKKARWETAYAAAEDPATRTKLTVIEKQEARKDYEAALREFVKSYLAYNPAVTDVDREDFEIPVHKTTRTPAPVADKAPYVTAIAHGPRQVRFDFGTEQGSTAKPAGQHGAEIASVIADTKPTLRQLAHSNFDTHSPLILTFEDEERGKTLWYAVRWENTRGEKGPWGEIVSVVIP